MNSTAILGLQWGDEGKGKIADHLAGQFNVVVRFQGGNNAGHTIIKGGNTYRLSSLPSGVLHTDLTSIIATGVVIDAVHLSEEISSLKKQGIEVTPNRLSIAENVHLILSLHRELDATYDVHNKIGTTARGIGPCYEDKVARRGIRICDLYNLSSLEDKVRRLLTYHNALRTGLKHHNVVEPHDIMQEILHFRDFIMQYAKSVAEIQAMTKNKKILFEGAQGALLDVDYGTYPFVTSSSTIHTSNAAIPSARRVLGVIKAYSTRVGNGPFPTEQFGSTGEMLQTYGKEVGTVTNRRRRCGWIDCAAIQYAIDVTSTMELALTKIDVLDAMKVIPVCTGYLVGGLKRNILPSNMEGEPIVPQYEEHPGWQSSTYGITSFEKLPHNAKEYINKLEARLERPIKIISTGAESSCIITK